MIRAGHLRTGDARQWAARAMRCACMVTAAGVTLCAATARAAEKANKEQPQPWVTISLRSLGVPSMPPAMMKVGSSMLTLDLVDDTHLLLTFSSRGLVPRIPNDPPDDEDRMVRAEVVELPTGRIVASTDWHMHDHARYLWRLGKGRFMVRSRHTLFVITPRALLGTAAPLKPMVFQNRDGLPLDAVISPDEGMLTVETLMPPKRAAARAVDTGLELQDPKPQVMMDFFRVTGGDEPGAPMKVSGVGLVKAPGAVTLPMDADGYLWPGDSQHGRWPLTFNEFGGREVKIGDVDSSCAPRLQMVSRFEFLAFTCMGTDSRTRMKAYGMDGHETWEESMGGSYGLPEFAFAPAAGRFAISRISSVVQDLDVFAGATAVPDGATQEVRVYQTESGDLLLKVPTNPVTRFAENFDLSEDGLVAAVVNDGAVQVYKLPKLTKQDVKDLEEAKSFSPPVSVAPVSFAKMEMPEGGDGGSETSSAGADVAAAATPSLAGTAGSGSGGGGGALPSSAAPPPPAVAPSAPAAADAAVAAQGGGAGPSPAAEVKTASATKDSADAISDEEAAKALGLRLPAAQPAANEAAARGGPAAKADPAAATDAGVAAKDGDATAKSAPATQASGDASHAGTTAKPAQTSGDDGSEATPRKPPTLLEPGEKVEKPKGSGFQPK